jgi:hypothetical protein
VQGNCFLLFRLIPDNQILSRGIDAPAKGIAESGAA